MESPEGLPAVRKSVERGVRVNAEAIEGAVEELADALSTHTGITLEDARDRVFAKSVNPHRRSDGPWADAWRAAKDAESPAVPKAQSGEASAMAEIDQLTDQLLRQHPQATRAVAVSAVLATHRGASAYRKYCDSQRAVARARSAR